MSWQRSAYLHHLSSIQLEMQNEKLKNALTYLILSYTQYLNYFIAQFKNKNEKLKNVLANLKISSSQHLLISLSHVLNISTTHRLFLFIRLAAKAAPKPLSIFTTVMPLAQEFSIASRAVTP